MPAIGRNLYLPGCDRSRGRRLLLVAMCGPFFDMQTVRRYNVGIVMGERDLTDLIGVRSTVSSGLLRGRQTPNLNRAFLGSDSHISGASR